jgi:ferritin-like metal-binding protein YciE
MKKASKNTPVIHHFEKLFSCFVDNLNIVYCVNAHLTERLSEIADQDEFLDLKAAIIATQEKAEAEIAFMDNIYSYLDQLPSLANCNGIITSIEDAYSIIHQSKDNIGIRDITILFYMQHITDLRASAIIILQIAAIQSDDKEVLRLITEHTEAIKSNPPLLSLLMAKYFPNNLKSKSGAVNQSQ